MGVNTILEFWILRFIIKLDALNLFIRLAINFFIRVLADNNQIPYLVDWLWIIHGVPFFELLNYDNTAAITPLFKIIQQIIVDRILKLAQLIFWYVAVILKALLHEFLCVLLKNIKLILLEHVLGYFAPIASLTHLADPAPFAVLTA